MSLNPFFAYFKHYRKPVSRYWFMPKMTFVKHYQGLREYTLPSPRPIKKGLVDIFQQRRSDRSFMQEKISIFELSDILFYSAGQYPLTDTLQGIPRRTYPSGGGKFPIELYVLVQNVERLSPGLYHYMPDKHTIELVTESSSLKNRDYLKGFLHEYAQDVAAMFFFSFIKERSLPKYGYFAYKIGLIEAGHISQNMYLLASALELKCCAFGDFNENKLHEALKIDGYNETLFYAVGFSGREKSPNKIDT